MSAQHATTWRNCFSNLCHPIPKRTSSKSPCVLSRLAPCSSVAATMTSSEPSSKVPGDSRGWRKEGGKRQGGKGEWSRGSEEGGKERIDEISSQSPCVLSLLAPCSSVVVMMTSLEPSSRVRNRRRGEGEKRRKEGSKRREALLPIAPPSTRLIETGLALSPSFLRSLSHSVLIFVFLSFYVTKCRWFVILRASNGSCSLSFSPPTFLFRSLFSMPPSVWCVSSFVCQFLCHEVPQFILPHLLVCSQRVLLFFSLGEERPVRRCSKRCKPLSTPSANTHR